MKYSRSRRYPLADLAIRSHMQQLLTLSLSHMHVEVCLALRTSFATCTYCSEDDSGGSYKLPHDIDVTGLV